MIHTTELFFSQGVRAVSARQPEICGSPGMRAAMRYCYKLLCTGLSRRYSGKYLHMDHESAIAHDVGQKLERALSAASNLHVSVLFDSADRPACEMLFFQNNGKPFVDETFFQMIVVFNLHTGECVGVRCSELCLTTT